MITEDAETTGVGDEVGEGFEELLAFLKDGRGFDFTGYKRSSLSRRVTKRMTDIGIDSYVAYLDHVQVHPEEVAELFDTILVNVTAFRRDPEHWDHVRDAVLAPLAARTDTGEPIRVWSAGCSTGEEAYTLAMEFCELMGVETFKERVKIYATDMDGDALEQARRGAYEPRHLAELPPAWVERYFEPNGRKLEFRRDIRRSVIFGRHDLVQDAPISRIDLLVCRNLLMYFTSDTQARILSRLHVALRDDGFMFLGRAEMLSSGSRLFWPVDLLHRVFTKNPDTIGAGRTPPLVATVALPHFDHRAPWLADRALHPSSVAQIGLDRDGTVALVNRAARELFGLRGDAIGVPFGDLEVSRRPLELRGVIEEAQRDRRRVRLTNVACIDDEGDVQLLDIELTPLRDGDGTPLGLLVSYEDVSALERLRADLRRSHHDVESAYEELLTTNEELRSTIEELQSANEELLSANEELGRMNQELQTQSLERQEIHAELRRRTAALDEANEFLEAVLSSLGTGSIVVDRDMRVQLWDDTSTDLWGLREEEVLDRRLTELEFGLPVAALTALFDGALGRGEKGSTTVTGINRVGREVRCDVRVVPLGQTDPRRGAVVLVAATPT